MRAADVMAGTAVPARSENCPEPGHFAKNAPDRIYLNVLRTGPPNTHANPSTDGFDDLLGDRADFAAGAGAR